MSVLVVGEALVDLVWHSGAGVITPAPGGSPTNVAVGLHRLGRPVTLATCWGDDRPGALVEAYLRSTGVPVVRAESATGRTTLALAHVDDATGAATYDFVAAWDPVRLPIPPDVSLLHTGSLALAVQPGAERVLEACRRMRDRPDGVVSVDLNVRPGALPDRTAYRRAVEEAVASADVVKASDEDLAWLYPDRSAESAARDLLAVGPRMVVVTYGARGARALTAGADVAVTAPEVRVADTIGAGDAFQSALLAALFGPGHDGRTAIRLPTDAASAEHILRAAVTAGALACTRPGAQPPTRAELEAALSGSGARHDSAEDPEFST